MFAGLTDLVQFMHRTGGVCRVNGQAIREGGFEVHAAYGAAAAHECAVAGLFETGDHTCGAATELRVVPAGKHAAGRAFLGTEVVHAHLTGAAYSTLLIKRQCANFYPLLI